ncbi:MAG: methyl-accepting chemotaxis protein [Pseudomonadota bacterium]
MSADQSPVRATAASLPEPVSLDSKQGTGERYPNKYAHPNRRKSDRIISDLARRTVNLGRDVIEVAAFIDDLDVRSQAQRASLSHARDNANEVVETNHGISKSLSEVRAASNEVEELVDSSVEILRNTRQYSTDIVDHVVEITERMDAVLEALHQVQAGNQNIRDIAKTVHLLAINARIEAARAGVAGTGFATIASSINELANTTSTTVEAAQDSVEELTLTIRRLSEGSQTAQTKTDHVIAGNKEMSSALEEISKAMNGLNGKTSGIMNQVGQVQTATGAFGQAFHDIEGSIADTSERISLMRDRTSSLISQTESMVQDTVDVGAKTEESPFIDRVREDAAKIGALFEAAIEKGQISTEDLFSRDYTPIAGTNPEQVMAPFTNFTDMVLPAIQEGAFSLDPSVVFCAAVNLDGYLPTHNRRFSKQQGRDVAWNMGNARNRRIFDDRVGLKAGQNTKPFLLQVYRRDMGGGVFKVMKDLSAPIMVHGRHWGGLRLAYQA